MCNVGDVGRVFVRLCVCVCVCVCVCTFPSCVFVRDWEMMITTGLCPCCSSLNDPARRAPFQPRACRSDFRFTSSRVWIGGQSHLFPLNASCHCDALAGAVAMQSATLWNKTAENCTQINGAPREHLWLLLYITCFPLTCEFGAEKLVLFLFPVRQPDEVESSFLEPS